MKMLCLKINMYEMNNLLGILINLIFLLHICDCNPIINENFGFADSLIKLFSVTYLYLKHVLTTGEKY